MTTAQDSENKPKKKSLGKVKVELVNNPNDGSCPGHNWVYILGSIILVLYSAYLYDKSSFHDYAQKYFFMEPIEKAFIMIEKYSPFQEFLDDDNGASLKKSDGERIMTKDELKLFNGEDGSPGLYLAMMGQIFDVSKGKDHYGPKGGYAFFSAKDGTRAFVTGQFDEQGLIEDIEGLSNGDYIGLKEWLEFYHKDYKYVGKLVGKYFDSNGQPTEYSKKVAEWIKTAENDVEKKNIEKQMFPPCNSEWSEAKGHRVWCTKKSGGIDRTWAGVPRRLFYPGRKERCACVKDTGPPSSDPSAQTNHGDLKSPHVEEYDGCNPKDSSCTMKSS